MEEIYGEVMPKFYEWYSFKRGGTPGGDFTGKHSSLIWNQPYKILFSISSLLFLLFLKARSFEECSMSFILASSKNFLETLLMSIPGSTTWAASSTCIGSASDQSSQRTSPMRTSSRSTPMPLRMSTSCLECLRHSRSTFCQVVSSVLSPLNN